MVSLARLADQHPSLQIAAFLTTEFGDGGMSKAELKNW